jgi:hypothetical protein
MGKRETDISGGGRQIDGKEGERYIWKRDTDRWGGGRQISGEMGDR